MKPVKIFLAALALSHASFAAPALAQSPSNSDLQALRFYLSEGNDQAVSSEIRRLQLRYPDWVVPDDMSTLQSSTPQDVIDQIYAQIEAGDLPQARALLDQADQDYPDWSPSSSLLSDLALAESQASFDQVVSMGDAEAAIRIGTANPDLLRCERVNNAWLLAEQYASVGDNAAALQVQNGVVRSCTDPDILVATLEKSAAIANASQLGAMADAARAQAPGAAERLTAVEERLQAGMGATSAEQSSTQSASADAPAASKKPATQPKPRASAQSSSAGMTRARQAAQRGDWGTCLAATASATRADTVAQRGWCAFNAGRPMQALEDFRSAASRAPSAQSRRDASYGLALVLLRLNMVNDAASVAANTHFNAEQRLEIESQILDKRGVAAYQQRQYRRAIAYFDELERLTGVVRRDLALLRGYAYLNSGNRARARREFQALHNQMATPASRRALSEASH